MFGDVVVEGVCLIALLTLLVHPASFALTAATKGRARSRRKPWVSWALEEGYVSQRVLAQWTGARSAAVACWLVTGIPACYEREIRELADLVDALSTRCSRPRAARLVACAAVAREHRRIVRVLARDGVNAARRAVAAGALDEDDPASVHQSVRILVRP